MDCKMLNEDGFGVQCCNSSSANLRLQIGDWRAPTKGLMIICFQKKVSCKNYIQNIECISFLQKWKHANIFIKKLQVITKTLIYEKPFLLDNVMCYFSNLDYLKYLRHRFSFIYIYIFDHIHVYCLYVLDKVIMQGKLFQTHLSNKKSMKYSGHRKLLSKFNVFNLLGY